MNTLLIALLMFGSMVAKASLFCEVFKTDRNLSDEGIISLGAFELSKDSPKRTIVLEGDVHKFSNLVVMNSELKTRSLPSGEIEEYGIFGVKDHWQFVYSQAPKNERESYYRVRNNFYKVKCN